MQAPPRRAGNTRHRVCETLGLIRVATPGGDWFESRNHQRHLLSSCYLLKAGGRMDDWVGGWMTAVVLHECAARVFVHSFNKLVGAFSARPGKGGRCWGLDRAQWATDIMVFALLVLKVL